MNEKIKEMLEDIDKKECYYVGTNGCLYQDLTKEELLLIKDCITNLQEKIEYNDLVLKALHKYFTEHEFYEIHEFLRKLESCTESDMTWLRRMAGVNNER